MEKLLKGFRGKFYDNINFPVIKLKILGQINELMFERLGLNQMLLSTFDVFDLKGDVLDFIEQKNIKVRFNQELKRTELEFEFQEFDVVELLISEWDRIIERIIIILIKIHVNNAKDETSSGVNMQVSWIQGKKESFNIHTASLMIYNIYLGSYTFSVEFRYESYEKFSQDQNILKFLKENRDTEELFCLEEVKFNDKDLTIIFQEHIENNEISLILENLENYSTRINSYIYVQDKTIQYSNDISKFLKLNSTNSIFISPSLVKLSNFQFSDLVQIHNQNDFNPTFNFILTQKSYLENLNLSSTEPLSNIFIESEDITPLFYPLNLDQEVIYNFQRLRALRHKNLVSVYGLKVINNEIGLFTEYLEKQKFLNSMKTFNYKKKLKIFKEIVKLVDFCQKRGFFFIGLDYDYLYFDSNGRVKVGLCYLNKTFKTSLLSPEEYFGFTACTTENFRLGLLMVRMFLQEESEDAVLVARSSWINSNIPVFTEQILKAQPKICQIVSELTGFDPTRRLQCSQLLNMLED